MADMKFAIVGCGRIAHRHAVHITTFGTLKAVCDIDFDRASNLAKEYNATAYQYLDEMLAREKDVCVVCICTPNGLHADNSIKALNAGFHVLCEKPMATNVADARKMIEAAEKAERKLFIIKQNRFNAPVAAVKDAVDRGILGKLYSIQLSCFWNRNSDYYKNSWKGTKDMDGGTLYTQFSHFIDLLYWIVGDVKRVFALTSNFAHQGQIDFEDTGVVAVEFVNGALGTINYTVNSYNKNMEGALTIFAEKGTVKIGGEYLDKLEYQNIEGFKIEDSLGKNVAEKDITKKFKSNHDKVYENLINVLTNKSATETNSFESLKTVEIINKIYESAKQFSI